MYDTAWWGFMWMQGWNYVYTKKLQGFHNAWASHWRLEHVWLD
jgi:hypothetical protein